MTYTVSSGTLNPTELQLLCLSTLIRTLAAGRGRGACATGGSRGTVKGATFAGAKIWNSEILPLLANWCLHCRQIFYAPLTFPVLGPLPQLSLFHDPTQSSVYIKKLTLVIWLIIHLL